MERRSVCEYVCDVEEHSNGWPPSNLMEFVAWLNELVSLVPEQYRILAQIHIGSCSGWGDDHYANVSITYLRPETDDEYLNRMNEAGRKADQKRAEELEMLHRLKAKYEGAA